MSESQSSNKKTSKKTSRKTSTTTTRKRTAATSSKKGSTSQKKGVKTEKTADGFKKFHIPVKVINTPKIEERKMLQSVPETVESKKEGSSNGIKSSPKMSSIKKRKKDPSDKSKQKKEKEEKKEEKQKKEEKKGVTSDQVHASDSDIKDFTPKKGELSSEEGSSEDTSPSKTNSRSFSFSMYRKLAVTFIVLTILLLGGVFYFSFPSLAITVTPQKEDIGDSLMVEVHNSGEDQTSSDSSVRGVVKTATITQEKTFQSTGARTIGKEIEGKVRVINNYTQDQPLVETTRLLSPNEKLYRIEERVVVPAGGSREVEVYTEDPSPEMAIDPTEFTIPGLWAGLQDDIYAKSEEGFEYRVKVQRYVQQSDIDKALEKIRGSLEQKAKEKFGSGYKGKQESVFNIESDSITTSVSGEAGDEKDEFTVKIKAQVQVAAFDNEKMADLASKKLTVLTSDSKELCNFKRGSIDYRLENFNSEEGVATIRSSFRGEMVPAQDSGIIDKDKITDLNKEQLISYLDDVDEIKDYQLDFSPAFLQKVPNLNDRIEIKIKTR